MSTGIAPEVKPAARRAVLFGCLAGFVVATDLVRFARFDPLTASDAAWAVPRLALGLLVAACAVAAAVLAAGLFLLWSKTERSSGPVEPLLLSSKALGLVALAALGFGVLVRFAWLDTIPPTIWIDEVLPIRLCLGLEGRWSDFQDAIRIRPTEGTPYVFGGVLYLEGFRWVLRALGTTVFAMRVPGALEGSISLVTAFLLARALLPRGGGTAAILVLAGLRWQIILARFGWNALALAPIADLATLLLIRARRRSSLAAAVCGGLVAGLGAHVYLGAWIVAAALAGFLLWPQANAVAIGHRVALTLLFLVGFLAAVSPIFLLNENRPSAYFGRASDQSLLRDIQRTKSWMPPFAVAADSLQAPWFVPDPVARQDLPQSRLGWILGVPVAAAFLRAFRSPKGELSALVLAHAGAAAAASFRWGFPGHPNGFRFLYLTTVTAVVAASGTLWLVGLVARPRRRAAAIAALGLLGVSSLLGARDALFRWGESRETFDAYSSHSTVVGRAALRWSRYATVQLDADLPGNDTVLSAVRDNALDPDDERARAVFFRLTEPEGTLRRCVRVAAPAATPRPEERPVEMLRDSWGRDHGVVLARRCEAAPAAAAPTSSYFRGSRR
jgi:hypothetical protein